MPTRRTLAPLATALVAAALVLGIVHVAGDRAGGGAGSSGTGGSPQVLHIGKPVTYGDAAKGTGRYVVTGDLSGAPTSAAVRHVAPSGDLEARVTALAGALGLGTPARHGDTWRATRGPAVLTVSAKSGNPWTYSPGGDACPLPTDPSSVACGAFPLPSNAPAVDPATARAQAERVLRAADPSGCSPCRAAWDPTGSPQAQYETTPSVDGRPLLGYVSTAVVTASGVVAANGWLGGTVAGATYPLVTPAAALAQLANGPQPAIGCAAPSPDTPPSDVPLVCRARIEVTGVQLALGLAWDSGRPVLVPTWTFTVADSAERPQQVAIDPAYLADPTPSSTGPGGGASGSSGSTGSGGSGGSGVSTGSTGVGGGPVLPSRPTVPPESATVAPEPTVS